MFADIVGSSAMVAGRDPEEADDALLAIIQVLVDAVHRYRGVVSQVLGDGVLAVFGAPVALEDHALRACLAAQDIVDAARTGCPRGEEDGNGTLGAFAVRIGIASGEVLSETVANGLWTDFRTVGETVHLAAKLQQRAAPNTVLVSDATVRLAPSGLSTEFAPALRLAPDVAPHPARRLLAARASRRTAVDLMQDHASPFVGREGEILLLSAALGRARDGQGGAVLVVGDAGFGKSRLVGEFLRRHSGAGAGADPEHMELLQWPQSPMRRLGEPDDIERVARSLAVLAAHRGGDGATAVCAAAAVAGGLAEAAVCELLGRPVRDPMWEGLDSAQRLGFAVEGLVVATTEFATDRPLVVLVEDAHWASPVMCRLLDTLAGSVDRTRVLLLATARPDEPTGWSGIPRMVRVDVNALNANHTDEFLERWLGDDPALARIKDKVAERSQGVPLYLEESLRALETAGAISGSNGRYHIGDPDCVVELPASVRGLIAARIDSLGSDARCALRAAAVIGPTFDVGLLRHLAPVASSATMKILADLERAGFLHRSRLMPNLEYSFRHALVQEVAYAGIARRERPELHDRVLRALRQRHDRDLPGRLELLAHHAPHAENWPLAYVYGRFAGQRAEARSKLADACQFYASARGALDRIPQGRGTTLRRIDLGLALARAMIPQGLKGGVSDLVTEACGLAAQAGHSVRHARASSLLAAYIWVYGDLDEAIALSRQALASLGDGSCLETRVQVLARLSGMLADKGLYREACRTITDVGDLLAADPGFGRCGLTVVAKVVTHAYAARHLAELGEMEAAVRAGERGVEVADECGHAFSKIVAHLHLGMALSMAGRADRSIPHLQTGLKLADAIRSQIFQPLLLGALGHAMAEVGDVDEAVSLIRASREHLRVLGQRRHLPQVLIWLAEALLAKGAAAEAEAVATDAMELASTARQLADEAWACFLVAKARAVSGLPALPGRDLPHAAERARALDLQPLLDRCEAMRVGALT